MTAHLGELMQKHQVWWSKSTVLVGASCVLAVCSAPYVLADTTQTPSSTDNSGGLEEIVVTAQRREQSLEKTPIAVSVVGADALAQQQIVTEQDLVAAVPGLTVRAGLSSNQLNYAIRGQSLDLFSFNRPGVLPYFNEVQVSSNATSSAFYDLQSIQVLKGPQGTLFGRSATGGAVLPTTLAVMSMPPSAIMARRNTRRRSMCHSSLTPCSRASRDSTSRATAINTTSTRDRMWAASIATESGAP
jgi:outer membrane receptor protein involved in Fe transport